MSERWFLDHVRTKVDDWIHECKDEPLQDHESWEDRRFIIDLLRLVQGALEDPDITGLEELIHTVGENEEVPLEPEAAQFLEGFLRGVHAAASSLRDDKTMHGWPQAKPLLLDILRDVGEAWAHVPDLTRGDRKASRLLFSALEEAVEEYDGSLGDLDWAEAAEGVPETAYTGYHGAYITGLITEFSDLDKPDGEARIRGEAPSSVEVISEVEVTFEDVVGMDEAKQQLAYSIKLLESPDLAKAHDVPPVTGILLYGPPGTGKTFFAKAAAGTFNKAFLRVDAASLNDAYHGETEKNIKQVFEFARKNAPCILFFDEFDAIAASRENRRGAEWTAGHVNQLLEQLDGMTKSSLNQPIVIAATNFADRLDSAVKRPGRFDCHIEVGLPTTEARAAMFAQFLAKRAAPGLDVQEFATMTEGWSAAEVKGVVDAAKRAIFMTNPSDSPRPVARSDLVDQIDARHRTRGDA